MRRMLALALCLMLIGPAALARTYVVENYGTDESQGCNLLIGDDGELLTPAKRYNNIYEITPEGTAEADRRFAAGLMEIDPEAGPEDVEALMYSMDFIRMALMDGQGRLLTGFNYDGLDYESGYVIFTLPGEDRLTGAMDMDGNVVLEAAYAMVVPLTEGRWLTVGLPETDESGEERYALSLIDATGAARELGLHTRSRYVRVGEGRVCGVWNVVEYGEKMVYLAPDGEVLFDRGFDDAEDFVGGYAIVSDDDLYGMIDKTGAFALPEVYESIDRQRFGPIIAIRGDVLELYDSADLRLLTTMTLPEDGYLNVTAVTSGLIAVLLEDSRQIYDLDGTLLMEATGDEYYQLFNYPDGALTRLIASRGEWPEERYYLVDLAGNPVSGDYQLINECLWRQDEGRFVTGRFDVVNDADEQAMVNWSSFRYGLIDQDGNTLLPPVYDELRPLDFDRFWVVQGDRCGMIDAAGHWYFYVSDYEELMD